ncbi:ankyrin repeat domain-containing protein [Wolbachia pipientis]|uniref:Ankyrin repeat domain-containing protein n=1 Tax=Wolbachia pipientis TaxID=955 RepID=A0A7G5C9S3_WOLPI|nr:ankyrin repeat domain-containing protein [Wolbachia pipientis]QMV45957.1 ankyrin repeat domain-containing protein [Wolbachia pipientis]
MSLRSILQEVNSSSGLGNENLIDRIKDKLQQENQLIYDEWKKSEFDINYTFIILKCNLLLIAAENGYEKVVRYLIKNGANINVQDEWEKTSLHYSAQHEHTQVVEVLLEEGAGVNAQDENKETPLHYAAKHRHIKTVKLLLKNRANINLQDEGGRTPLHYAADNGYTQIAEALLKGGAGVDVQDKDGRTPLYYAVYYTYGEHPRLNYQHPKVAKLLLNYSADPSCIHRPKAITAGITVGILAAIVAPLALIYATVLPALAIVGITVASALIVGGIAYGVAYKASEHSLNSKLSEVSCSNVDGNKQTVQP